MASITADPVAAGSWPGRHVTGAAPVLNQLGAGIPVKRSEAIIKNCMVTILNSEGFAYNGINSANHIFAGVAAETVTGAAAADTTPVRRWVHGEHWFTLSGGGASDLGKECYLLFNATVVVADPGTGSIKVGRIVAMNAAFTQALVKIDSYC